MEINMTKKKIIEILQEELEDAMKHQDRFEKMENLLPDYAYYKGKVHALIQVIHRLEFGE